MILLGCKPEGRHTEQHDIFFGIANQVKDLVPAIHTFWPEAKGKIHLDAYRVINHVEGFKVEVIEKNASSNKTQRLFFMNLGGYQRNIFEELHYKMLIVDEEKSLAIKKAKESQFFKQYFSPHIDDKYGVDVDDVFEIEEVLPEDMKTKYQLAFTPMNGLLEDEIILGYMPINKL